MKKSARERVLEWLDAQDGGIPGSPLARAIELQVAIEGRRGDPEPRLLRLAKVGMALDAVEQPLRTYYFAYLLALPATGEARTVANRKRNEAIADFARRLRLGVKSAYRKIASVEWRIESELARRGRR